MTGCYDGLLRLVMTGAPARVSALLSVRGFAPNELIFARLDINVNVRSKPVQKV